MAKEVTAEQIQMLDEMVARAQKAADIVATYDQERVDRLCQAVAAAVCDMKVWANLADEAVDGEIDETSGVKVLNKTGSLLPSTGGIGTTIFYVVGGVLVLGAVVLLITKRRTSVDDE